ncbi:hypothetical protein IscW_ISCW011772 [Ixodes scapularis]|uniref:Uncharacterized protein n=1 Tax=Ixodes scapularis TaxID=6945 RepID=B7Q807_IXOSC|nr:hypothetical protein IscW_ISCW011772 [Ixodes scapularis]|eukprot:XP_002412258.1 hypothetical protein IscW_ISCW011772 [Ixodes scapularis]
MQWCIKKMVLELLKKKVKQCAAFVIFPRYRNVVVKGKEKPPVIVMSDKSRV